MSTYPLAVLEEIKRLRKEWADLKPDLVPMEAQMGNSTARFIVLSHPEARQLREALQFHEAAAKQGLARFGKEPNQTVATTTARHMMYANLVHEALGKVDALSAAGSPPFALDPPA